MIHWYSIFSLVSAMICAPFLKGVIARTKAILSGRMGASVFQPYFDLWRIFQKKSVYSKTTSWIFKTGPVIYFVTILIALFFLPLGNLPAILQFQGDFIVLIYLLGLGRFFMVIAALDTGSSFEGMGASREVFFAFFAEIILFLCFITLSLLTKVLSLAEIHFILSDGLWLNTGVVLFLVVVALFVVFLIENSRIPFDDPNTHLELTMIHEVMILDHSGPELGLILYASQLKVWIFGLILLGIAVPFDPQAGVFNVVVVMAGMILLSLIVGVIESVTARLKLFKISQFLIGAMTISMLALILALGGR